MQFITAVSKSSKKAETIKQALLESNPVLEGIIKFNLFIYNHFHFLIFISTKSFR